MECDNEMCVSVTKLIIIVNISEDGQAKRLPFSALSCVTWFDCKVARFANQIDRITTRFIECDAIDIFKVLFLAQIESLTLW